MTRSATDESEVDALLAFDRALAAGLDPPASARSDLVLTAGTRMPASARGGLAAKRRAIVRACRKSSGGSRSSASWAAAASGSSSWLRIRCCGRQVALKVPRPEVLVTPEVRRRFLREAEAASRLDHPHIVPVYEVGEEGPICYIASAYCEGLTLAQWLRLQTIAGADPSGIAPGGGSGGGGCARPRAGHSSPRSETGQHLAPATATATHRQRSRSPI